METEIIIEYKHMNGQKQFYDFYMPSNNGIMVVKLIAKNGELQKFNVLIDKGKPSIIWDD